MSRVIFVGNLPDDVKEREVEDIFAKYGKIIVVHTPSSTLEPPFDPEFFEIHSVCFISLAIENFIYRYLDTFRNDANSKI